MTTAGTSRKKSVESAFVLPEKSIRLVAKYWKLFALVNLPFLLLAIPPLLGKDTSTGRSGANPFSLNANTEEPFANLGLSLLFIIAFLFVTVFFYAMKIRLSLDATTDKKTSLQLLVSAGSKFWLRLLALSILSGVIIIAGAILLIVPGIIAFVLLLFAPFILIDQNTTVIDAVKGSYNMVKSNVGAVLSAMGVFILAMLGASIIMEVPYIGPLVGTIISILLSLILYLRYQELKGTAKAQSPQAK